MNKIKVDGLERNDLKTIFFLVVQIHLLARLKYFYGCILNTWTILLIKPWRHFCVVFILAFKLNDPNAMPCHAIRRRYKNVVKKKWWLNFILYFWISFSNRAVGLLAWASLEKWNLIRIRSHIIIFKPSFSHASLGSFKIFETPIQILRIVSSDMWSSQVKEIRFMTHLDKEVIVRWQMGFQHCAKWSVKFHVIAWQSNQHSTLANDAENIT